MLGALSSRKLNMLFTKMKKIILRNRKNISSILNWQGEIFNYCVLGYAGSNISCVGRRFRNNWYIRTSKTTIKKKKYSQLSFVTRDAVAHRNRHTHAHTQNVKPHPSQNNSHFADQIAFGRKKRGKKIRLLFFHFLECSSPDPVFAAFSQDTLYVQMRRQYSRCRL